MFPRTTAHPPALQATGTVTGYSPAGVPQLVVDGQPDHILTAAAWPASPVPVGAVVLILFMSDGSPVIAAHLTRTPTAPPPPDPAPPVA